MIAPLSSVALMMTAKEYSSTRSDVEHNEEERLMTFQNGAPLHRPLASQRVGNQLRGHTLMQDTNLMETIQHFTHERVPERVVHAKGVGAYGYFEVTSDITDVCDAAFLDQVGKKTELFARFSTVAREKGSPETIRDTRGFAFKMYTEEGNLDWLFLSTPVFPIRDGAKFPSFTHAAKRDPQSNLLDRRAFWDYFTQNQEGINFLMYYFSDRATPTDFQHADCFSINTYRMVKKDGTFSYVKIHCKTNQGTRYFNAEQSERHVGMDPEHQTRQMFESLEGGDMPSWDIYAQVIDPAKADKYPVNIFDCTKTLPECDFPLRKFGRIVLNRNVDNFHAETDQSAFAVTNVVPGWALTPDPILQTRCLAYTTAQRHRISTNFHHLPVNRVKNCPFYFTPTQRDGSFVIDSWGKTPNYYPSSFMPQAPPSHKPRNVSEWKPLIVQENWQGPVVDFQSEVTEADFAQARVFWDHELPSVDGVQAQENFAINVMRYMHHVKEKELRQRIYDMFSRVNRSLGHRIADLTEKDHMQRDLHHLRDMYIQKYNFNGVSANVGQCPFGFGVDSGQLKVPQGRVGLSEYGTHGIVKHENAEWDMSMGSPTPSSMSASGCPFQTPLRLKKESRKGSQVDGVAVRGLNPVNAGMFGNQLV